MRAKLLTLGLAALAATALLTAACSGDDDNTTSATATKAPAAGTNPASSGGTETIDITASDFKFDKTTLNVKSGDTVTVNFKNDGSAKHSFNLGDTLVTEAGGGSTSTGTFTATTTTLEFHCKYHPSTMKGTITLGSSTQNLASPTAAPGGYGGIGY